MLGDESVLAEAQDGDARKRHVLPALAPARPPLDRRARPGDERLAEAALDALLLGEDALDVVARAPLRLAKRVRAVDASAAYSAAIAAPSFAGHARAHVERQRSAHAAVSTAPILPTGRAARLRRVWARPAASAAFSAFESRDFGWAIR